MGDTKDEEKENGKVEKMQELLIPSYVLTQGISPDNENPEPPKYPLLVFVNSKSGGQLGGAMLNSFRDLLNPKQVYDLAEGKPEAVLHKVLGHLEKLKEDGDKVALHIRTHLRIIVAGGDGTAGWLLGILGDLKLEHPPPVATIPLGTGNNLPFSFGWGKKNPGTDVQSVKEVLNKVVLDARPLRVDSWHVTMKMTLPEHDDSLEPLKVPHSLHPFQRVSKKDQLHEEGRQTFRGGFWNYLSMGMDAEVAYAFHSEREKNADKFKNQFKNQVQYGKLTCAQGWFCASCCHPRSKNIRKLANIKVAKHGEEWKELKLSKSIRSILMLSLPSFSGGLNPWGTPGDKISKKRGLTQPFVDDGLLEIVGFKDAWHGAVLFSRNGHGVRLAQAHRVRVEFHSGAANETYLRMDGEPWLQPLPSTEEHTVLEITQLGQSLVLTTKDCLAKSDSKAPAVAPSQEIGVENAPKTQEAEKEMTTGKNPSFSSCPSDEESLVRGKFGAASTFNTRKDVESAATIL